MPSRKKKIKNITRPDEFYNRLSFIILFLDISPALNTTADVHTLLSYRTGAGAAHGRRRVYNTYIIIIIVITMCVLCILTKPINRGG